MLSVCVKSAILAVDNELIDNVWLFGKLGGGGGTSLPKTTFISANASVTDCDVDTVTAAVLRLPVVFVPKDTALPYRPGTLIGPETVRLAIVADVAVNVVVVVVPETAALPAVKFEMALTVFAVTSFTLTLPPVMLTLLEF